MFCQYNHTSKHTHIFNISILQTHKLAQMFAHKHITHICELTHTQTHTHTHTKTHTYIIHIYSHAHTQKIHLFKLFVPLGGYSVLSYNSIEPNFSFLRPSEAKILSSKV